MEGADKSTELWRHPSLHSSYLGANNLTTSAQTLHAIQLLNFELFTMPSDTNKWFFVDHLLADCFYG